MLEQQGLFVYKKTYLKISIISR